MGDQSKPGVASGISTDDTSGAAVTSFSVLMREMSDPRVFQQGRVPRKIFGVLNPNMNQQQELFLVENLRNALQEYQRVNPSSQEIIIGGKSIQPSANGYIFKERDNAGLLNQISISSSGKIEGVFSRNQRGEMQEVKMNPMAYLQLYAVITQGVRQITYNLPNYR